MTQTIKGVGTLHTPIYLINGIKRREMKKELSQLKNFVKKFPHYNDIDKVYGGGIEENKEQEIIEKANVDIDRLEKLLKITFSENNV